jgi:hypothetical protein
VPSPLTSFGQGLHQRSHTSKRNGSVNRTTETLPGGLHPGWSDGVGHRCVAGLGGRPHIDAFEDEPPGSWQRKLFEAAKTSARGCAPGYGYYTTVKERIDANRACLSQARRIVRQAVHLLADLGDEAFTIVAQPAAPSTIAR